MPTIQLTYDDIKPSEMSSDKTFPANVSKSNDITENRNIWSEVCERHDSPVTGGVLMKNVNERTKGAGDLCSDVPNSNNYSHILPLSTLQKGSEETNEPLIDSSVSFSEQDNALLHPSGSTSFHDNKTIHEDIMGDSEDSQTQHVDSLNDNEVRVPVDENSSAVSHSHCLQDRRHSYETNTGASGSTASSLCDFGFDEQSLSLQESSFAADNDDSVLEKDNSGPDNEDMVMEEDEGGASSGSDAEWEDVEELPVASAEECGEQQAGVQPSESDQATEKTLKITIAGSEEIKKKSKKPAFDKRDWFRQQMNRFKKETQENVHKVHLLCLLSHLQQRNALCCDELLKAAAMSLLPSEKISPLSWNTSTLGDFVFWFRQIVVIDQKINENPCDMAGSLLSRMADRKVASAHEHTLLFVLLSRSIGLPTRLVYSLQPIPFKPCDLVKALVPRPEGSCPDKIGANTSSSLVHKLDEDKTPSSLSDGKGQTEQKMVNVTVENVKEDSLSEDGEKKALKRKCDSTLDLSPVNVKFSTSTPVKSQLRMCQSEPLFRETTGNSQVILIDDNSSDNLVYQSKSARRSLRGFKMARRQCSQRVSYTELSLSEESSGAEDNVAESSRLSRDSGSNKKLDSSSDMKQQKNSSKISSAGDGDDWETSLRQTSSASVVTSQEAVYQRSEIQRIKDSDPTLRPGCDWWAEVYLEKEQNWIYVNTVVPVVNQPDEAEVLATRPMSYVLALDNDNYVKDLTKKYAGHWLSCARKLRLNEDWWQQVLAPFQHSDSERDQLENKRIYDQLMRKSLPATITEYKNHPLYALKRHLLKFEALYPPNATVFGVIRGEPIYARDSVYLLHTKDKWLIEGRCVRDGELPYKKVQSRLNPSKSKKFNEECKVERKVELYGPWQTDEYKPPVAVNGKVPVNEFGNVSVFKPWMIPIGTVHLPEPRPGLNKIARRLDIDCQPAVIAWDFHNGFNHPIIGGWVVCEEYKNTLLAAWEEELIENKKKEIAKKKQRIYENWRKMIKGLLIRERIKTRFEEPGLSQKKQVDTDANGDTVASDATDTDTIVDTTLSWPQNFKSSRISKNLPSTFPFETL